MLLILRPMCQRRVSPLIPACSPVDILWSLCISAIVRFDLTAPGHQHTFLLRNAENLRAVRFVPGGIRIELMRTCGSPALC